MDICRLSLGREAPLSQNIPEKEKQTDLTAPMLSAGGVGREGLAQGSDDLLRAKVGERIFSLRKAILALGKSLSVGKRTASIILLTGWKGNCIPV